MVSRHPYIRSNIHGPENKNQMVPSGVRILNGPTFGASNPPTTKRTTARPRFAPLKNNPDRIKIRGKSTEKTKPNKKIERGGVPCSLNP
jgi:hypothetical protein